MREIGFEPTEFTWDEIDSDHIEDLVISRISHLSTAAFLTFDYMQDHHWSRHSPGREKSIDTTYPGDWTSQLALVKNWLTWTRREVESPDLWGVLAADQPLTQPGGIHLENSRFSDDEVRRIATGVNQIRVYIERTLQLTSIQSEFVAERLQFLQESSERLGRKDWVALALGTLANIVVGIAVAPEAAKDFLRTANSLLGWVVQGAVKLLN